MSRWIHNPEGRIIAFVRRLPESAPKEALSRRSLILVAVLIVFVGSIVLWPREEPATLPITAGQSLENRLIAGATGTVDGKRYLATLTASGPERAGPMLQLFRVSDSGELVLEGSLDAPLDDLEPEMPAPPSIAFAGEDVFVPLPRGRESLLWVVNVSDPETPRQLAALPLDTTPGSVAIDGGLAAVGPMDGTITRLFDIDDPAAPVLVGEYRHSLAGPAGIALNDRTLYVTDRYGVSAVDAASPVNAREIGRYEDDTWVSRLRRYPGYITPRITLEDDHIYAAADEYGINVLDISDSSDPNAATRALERNPGGRQGIAVDAAATGSHLVVLSRQGLDYIIRDIDISSPQDPAVAAETEAIPVAETSLASIVADDEFGYFLTGSTIHIVAISS